MLCETEDKFLETLKKSNIRTRDNKSVDCLYSDYLAKLNGAFPIKDFVNELGLKVEIIPLDLNISGKLEGNTIYVNSSNIQKRQNFTIAHELAHYLLEHGNTTDYRANMAYTQEQKIQEAEADNLAGSLLLPEKIIRDEVEKFKSSKKIEFLGEYAPEIIQQLSERFQVSNACVTVRLKILGYINGWVWI